MQRIHGLENVDPPRARSAITTGKFFAVHRGHQALLRATVEAARRHAAPAVVLTFDRHPLEILRPRTELPAISSLEERLDQIEACGVHLTVVMCLTPALLSQEPEEFVREVLVWRLGAVEVLSSEQFRFGHRARGNIDLLRELGASCGFATTVVPPVMDGGERISSSRVAECIRAGKVADAWRLLGRPYPVPGVVQRGDQVGRKLGFPTANVEPPTNRLLPADGVYLVRLRILSDGPSGGAPLPAVANLGVRPTRDSGRHLLEVHILDWSGDLYDRDVAVEFLERLRDEQRFPDLEALRRQIAMDVEQARSRINAVAPAPDVPAPAQ